MFLCIFLRICIATPKRDQETLLKKIMNIFYGHLLIIPMSLLFSCYVFCNPARLLCPWNFLGKNTGVGCHFLLQEILTQELNPHLCIFCITGGFLTTELLGSPLVLGYHLSNHNKLQIPIMQRIIKNSNIYLRSNFC